MKYIIGNWKANKNLRETQQWVDQFTSKDLDVLKGQVTIVVCPPYPFIPLLNEAFMNYDHVHVGSQDISQYGAGTYTGEVPAHSLQDLVEYTLVGHSERHKHSHETQNSVDQKAQNASDANIEPIVLVRNEKDMIPSHVKHICYEPSDAISSGNLETGSGKTESVDDILSMKARLQLPDNVVYYYGGSVSPSNIRDFMSQSEIDGVIVGAGSLDPDTFYEICVRASHTTE